MNINVYTGHTVCIRDECSLGVTILLAEGHGKERQLITPSTVALSPLTCQPTSYGAILNYSKKNAVHLAERGVQARLLQFG
jgi:hypothetical protein